MREREMNELIIQIFEEQEELFYFPLNSQKDAKAFVKALNGKGLCYEKICDDIGESEHSFNSWRKSLGRTGVGQRVIDRINQPFIELLEEDADQLMHSVATNGSSTKHQNGYQNGVASPREFPVRNNKRESPNQHKQENESELADRLNRARSRLQLQENTKKQERQEDEKEEGSEEEVFSTQNSSHSSTPNTNRLKRDKSEEKSENARPVSQIEEVRMNLRRSSGNVDSKLKDFEKRSSLRERDRAKELSDESGVESTGSRNSVIGLLQKFESFSENSRQSNSGSPCNSSSKSNSEENICEVTSNRSDFKGQRSPSPPWRFKSPLSSPKSSRSSQSPERELSPRKSWSGSKENDSKVAEKESKVAEKESKVAEKESKVEEKESKVEERESKVAEKESELAEKESKVAEKESKGKDSRVGENESKEDKSKKENESKEDESNENESLKNDTASPERESKFESKPENESEESAKKFEKESTGMEKEIERTESESVQAENESVRAENESVRAENERSESIIEGDSFVTANGSHRDEYISCNEDDENNISNHVDAQNEDTFVSDTSVFLQSPHRESLKEKEERLAEQVKAEVTNLRKQVKAQFEAARKKKDLKESKVRSGSVTKDDVDVDENYNSDLDPDNEDQSPVMSKLVQKISGMRLNTKNGPGFLYVFSDSYDETARVKIGTSKFPEKRLRQAQVFNPDMWQVLAQPVNQRIAALDDLAASLQECAEPKTKYWFRCSFDKVIEAAEETVSKFASKHMQENYDSTC